MSLIATYIMVAAMASSTTPDPITVGTVKFEGDSIVAGHKLKLNGAGLRADNGKNIAMALYLSKKSRTLPEVLEAPGPKRLQMHLQADIEGKEFGTALAKAMQANVEAKELSACMPGLASLGTALSVKKRLSTGERLTMDFVPGQGTVVQLNDQQLVKIDTREFYGCLMQGYFGPQPMDAALKANLLGGAKK